MISIRSVVVLLVASLFVCLCRAQTLTYSDGWVNGKRSPTWSDIMVGPGHQSDNGPILISDSQLGRNYVCFVTTSQVVDTPINYGIKAGSQRSPQRRQGE